MKKILSFIILVLAISQSFAQTSRAIGEHKIVSAQVAKLLDHGKLTVSACTKRQTVTEPGSLAGAAVGAGVGGAAGAVAGKLVGGKAGAVAGGLAGGAIGAGVGGASSTKETCVDGTAVHEVYYAVVKIGEEIFEVRQYEEFWPSSCGFMGTSYCPVSVYKYADGKYRVSRLN